MSKNRFGKRTEFVRELGAVWRMEKTSAVQPDQDRAFISYIRGNYHRKWGVGGAIVSTTAAELEDLLDGRFDDFPDRARQKEHLLADLAPPPGIDAATYHRRIVDALNEKASFDHLPTIEEVPLTWHERDMIYPLLGQFGFYLNDRTLEPHAEVIDYWIRASEPCRDHLSPLVGEIAHVQAMYPDPDELDETLTDWYLHRPLDGWAAWLPRTAAYFTDHIREHDRRRKAERAQGKEPQ